MSKPAEGSFSFEIEAEQYREAQGARRRLFPKALAVGLASGLVAASFRWLLEGAEKLRGTTLDHLAWLPVPPALLAGLIAAVGAYLALVVGRLDPRSSGSGIPHMKAVLDGHSTINWRTILPSKYVGAVLAIGAGLGLGREGPTVQMGGAIGYGLADGTNASLQERKALAAAGAGSGLAAAFNAPLAGVTFVLEELQRDFQPAVFAAALLCAAVATMISRLAGGQQPAFAVPHISAPPLASLPVFLVLGALGGLAGVAFNRSLLSMTSLGSRLRKKSPLLVAALAGLSACAAYAVSPLVCGGGHSLSEAAIYGRLLMLPAAAAFLARFAFVQVSYSTGVPGGIFAPLLSLGALLGSVACFASQSMGMSFAGPAAFAVVGMCSMFSGVVRAPLTGVILIAEMTGGYDLLLPLLAASFAAYAVAEGLGDTPIYEALLRRDAEKEGLNLEVGELFSGEFEVSPGSPFDGRRVRDLALPPGVLITSIRSQGREALPGPDSLIAAHQRLTVRVQCKEGLIAMNEGTSPPGRRGG